MQTNSNTPSVAPAPRAPAPVSRTSAIRPASITYHNEADVRKAIGDVAKRAKQLLIALNDSDSPSVGPNSVSGLYFALVGATKLAEAVVQVSPTVMVATPMGIGQGGTDPGVDPLTGAPTCEPGMVLIGGRCFPTGDI